MKKSKSLATVKKSSAAAAAFALLPVAAPSDLGRNARISSASQERREFPQGKFFCNIHALTPAERAHHERLTHKLLAMRNEAVPTDKGYEFQYDPTVVSLAELTDWVAAESKCCPFFDFHIDLEHAGRLLCLRITGEQGIKPFIESEFHLR